MRSWDGFLLMTLKTFFILRKCFNIKRRLRLILEIGTSSSIFLIWSRLMFQLSLWWRILDIFLFCHLLTWMNLVGAVYPHNRNNLLGFIRLGNWVHTQLFCDCSFFFLESLLDIFERKYPIVIKVTSVKLMDLNNGSLKVILFLICPLMKWSKWYRRIK